MKMNILLVKLYCIFLGISQCFGLENSLPMNPIAQQCLSLLKHNYQRKIKKSLICGATSAACLATAPFSFGATAVLGFIPGYGTYKYASLAKTRLDSYRMLKDIINYNANTNNPIRGIGLLDKNEALHVQKRVHDLLPRICPKFNADALKDIIQLARMEYHTL